MVPQDRPQPFWPVVILLIGVLAAVTLMMWAGGRKQSNAGPNVQLSFPVTSIQVLIKAPGDKHGYLIFGQPEEITPTNGGWFIR
jgi:hypothetical protein